MSDSVFEIKTKKIIIAGKEFEIKPFVIRTRTKFLRVVFEVFKRLAEKRQELSLDKINPGDTTKMIPALIEAAGEKLIDIYSLVLEGAEKEWMEDNIQIKDEVIIINAIMEVNDISFLVSQVKNIANQAKELQSTK